MTFEEAREKIDRICKQPYNRCQAIDVSFRNDLAQLVVESGRATREGIRDAVRTLPRYVHEDAGFRQEAVSLSSLIAAIDVCMPPEDDDGIPIHICPKCRISSENCPCTGKALDVGPAETIPQCPTCGNLLLENGVHDCTGKTGERFAYDVTKMPKCARCGKPTSVKMFTDESDHPCDNCGYGIGTAGEDGERC